MEMWTKEDYYSWRLMVKNIKLYITFFVLQMKTIMEYKSDFIIGLLSVVIGQINTFLLTIVIFTQLDSLVGFTINEIILMYGFYVTIKGIDHFYNDNIWSFAWNKVRDGRFITVLLRPINPIFHIVMERIEITGLSETIVGIIIVVVFSAKLRVAFTVGKFFVLLLLLLCGLAVYFSVKLLFSAPAFWTVSCGEFMTAGVEVSNSAKYPVELYKNKIVKGVLLYLLPFPISAYFPTVYCLNREYTIQALFNNPTLTMTHMVLYVVIVTTMLSLVSVGIWNYGLKHYEPTGT
jgi:ABC-2 type transport system permease protein